MDFASFGMAGVAAITVICYLAATAVKQTPLANKWLPPICGALGGLLGLAKGVLLCAVVLLLLQKLFGDAEFLRHSRALPYFNSLISQVRGWLPPDLISRFGL